jgi:alpha-galactosidase
MPKIAFIGGGSAKFVGGLVRDFFSFQELRNAQVCLMDIDATRAQRAQRLVEKLIADRKLPATVTSTTDQCHALDGADYVIITIMVGGFEHYRTDGEIPKRYGVLPTVGDTIGPGAVFRLVRTAPVLNEIARNLRELSPNAWVLNYSNPMAMNTWALLDAGHPRSVGLCHSIQGSYRWLADLVGVPPDEVTYTAGGINHINFYLTLQHHGQDLYPMLLERKDEILAKHPHERPRFELLEYLGHFPAEGPHHQSEYYPWFRKNEQAADHYHVETMWGYHFDFKLNQYLTQEVDDWIAGRKPIPEQRSIEYGAQIIHSLETGTPRLFYGNVRNRQLIENLPSQAVVEVPCHVDDNGIFPCQVGRIPPQLAAVMTPHIHVHELAIEGVRRRDLRLIRQAIQADPLSGAILTLPRLKEMTDELAAANREYMNGWK